MDFNRSTESATSENYGKGGATITYSAGSYSVPNNCKAIVVVATGDVVCTPLRESSSITLTAWPAGAVLPWHCKTITESGTTATLATVLD